MDWIRRIWKTKTFKLAVGAILAAVGAYLGDKIGLVEMVVAIVVALQTVFVRDAIATQPRGTILRPPGGNGQQRHGG
ncbi:MAG TPA: hypothetical protein VM243_08485 [Phycisphaerae bacterium]|nr:hypothetical protein [Phycisphaerae bacterium]